MAKNIKLISTPELDKNLTPELPGKAICARRTQSNLSLEDAAVLCRVAKQTLMNIEHAKGNSQLTTVLGNKLILTTKNQDELSYLKKYRAMVESRCEHLLQQSSYISSIVLN